MSKENGPICFFFIGDSIKRFVFTSPEPNCTSGDCLPGEVVEVNESPEKEDEEEKVSNDFVDE